ncbi:MAG: tetratricopeptide repeat protein [Candidatus Kapaibacteriota bacterium]
MKLFKIKYIVFLALLFATRVLLAQTNEISTPPLNLTENTPKQPNKEDNLHYNKAILAAENKDYVTSLKEFAEALKLNPKNIFALYGRATVYYELGMKNEALADLTNLLKIDNKDEKALYLRAVINDQLARYEDAIKDYQALLKLNPNSDIYNLNIAYCYQVAGQKQQAIDKYLKAETLGNTSNELVYNLIGLYYEMKQYSNALKYIDKAYSKKLENDYVVSIQLEILLDQGDCEKSVEIVDKYSTLISKDLPAIYQNIADCFYQKENYEEASNYFLKSYSLKPELVESLFNSAVAKLKNKKIDSAISDFELFLEKTENRTDLDKLRTDARNQIDFFKKKNQK